MGVFEGLGVTVGSSVGGKDVAVGICVSMIICIGVLVGSTTNTVGTNNAVMVISGVGNTNGVGVAMNGKLHARLVIRIADPIRIYPKYLVFISPPAEICQKEISRSQ
jgi:hypothetical protein